MRRLRCRKRDQLLTGTAGGVVLELRGVVDGGELASGDGIADLDVDHID